MKAQIAAEYLFIMMFATVLLVGYVAIIADIQARTADQAHQAQAERIASLLQDETLLAAQVRDGYDREFYIPQEVRGQPVIIDNASRMVVVYIDDATSARLTPNYTGRPGAGWNTITKQGGTIAFG